jgi:hypothetical protein
VYSCATGVKACVDAGPDGAKTGSACGTSSTGTCAAGTCACPSGRQWNGTDCVACPAPTGSTLYADAAIGVDNACCGALATAGIGGACRTVTQALKNMKGSGWTINANGDAAGNAAAEEVYPLHLGSGVSLNSGATFGGSASLDVIVVDDGTTVSLAGFMSLGGRLSTLGRDGLVIRASATGVQSVVRAYDVNFGDVARDALHVDGGAFQGLAPSGYGFGVVGNAAIWCKSETTPSVPSSVQLSGNLSIGALPHSAATYAVFAGHGCTVGGSFNSVRGFFGTGSGPTCDLGWPIWAEDDATVYVGNLQILCARNDGVSLHPSPSGGAGTPSVFLDGAAITYAGCSGVRVDAGHARLRETSISYNRWGVYQHSALSSSDPVQALVDAAGDGTCSMFTGSCLNRFTLNNYAGSTAICCPAGSPCAPPADIVNQSGLPLIARGDTIGKCPASACTCNSALASCTCTGAAAGNTTPPAAGVIMLLAPLTSGTPTIDTTGSTCMP